MKEISLRFGNPEKHSKQKKKRSSTQKCVLIKHFIGSCTHTHIHRERENHFEVSKKKKKCTSTGDTARVLWFSRTAKQRKGKEHN